MGEMRQLVRDHGLELARLEPVDEPLREVQAGAVAAGGDDPRVRLALLLEHDLRLGEVGDHAQALDRGVQLGRGGRRELVGAHGRGALLPHEVEADRDRDPHADHEPGGRDGDHGGERGEHDERRRDGGHHHPRDEAAVGGEELAGGARHGPMVLLRR